MALFGSFDSELTSLVDFDYGEIFQSIPLSNGGYLTLFYKAITDANGRSLGAVYGQRFDAQGNKAGLEFLVSDSSSLDSYYAKANELSNGQIVLTWYGVSATEQVVDPITGVTYNYDIGGYQAKIINADGSTSGSIFTITEPDVFDVSINDYTKQVRDCQLVKKTDGSFGVLYRVFENGTTALYYQGYDVTGLPQGAISLVQTQSAVLGFEQLQVCATNDGGFILTWLGNGLADSRGVYCQRFDALGNAVGSEFLANTYTSSTQNEAELAVFADDSYIVVWQSNGQDGSGYGVYAQRFDQGGNKLGGEFLVNTITSGSQSHPDIITLSDGGFVIGWCDPTSGSVCVQRYFADGSKAGNVLNLSAAVGPLGISSSNALELTALEDGGFAISWQEVVFDPVTYAIQDTFLHQRVISNSTDASVDNYYFGTEGNDTFYGQQGDDVIYGFGGTDSFDGGAGNDYIVGGDGDDVITGMQGNDTLYGGLGNDIIFGDSPAQNYYGYNVIYGGDGDDQIFGEMNSVLVDAGSGNDYVFSGGNIDAGEGDDFLQVILSDTTHTILGGQGNDRIQLGWVFSSNTVTVHGGEGNDDISGSGNSIIYGDGGNDIFRATYGWSGNITYVGGVGDDIYFITSFNNNTLIEDLDSGIDTIVSNISYVLPDNFEELQVSGYGDLNVTGNSLGNKLTGNDENNLISGLLGIDTMIGLNGNDTYIVDNISDVITELNGKYGGIDVVNSSVDYTLSNNVENLILIGNAAITGFGNQFDNVVTGNSGDNHLSALAGNDRLDGGLGRDTMIGGVGDDYYVVDTRADVVVELAAEGTDTVETGVSYTLGANFENLSLSGYDAINGIGNELANSMGGNNGNNMLFGMLGNDTLSGGYGLDVLVGGDGDDYLDGGADRDQLKGGNGNDSLFGGDTGDSLKGEAGNDYLDGGTGADTFYGGAGDDTYIVDDALDFLFEVNGEGYDSVQSSISYTLRNYFEDLTLTGVANINGIGNTSANIIYGNDGNNQLFGMFGNDTIYGGLGNDTISGGDSNDVLYGEDGNDQIKGGFGNDSLFGGIGNDNIKGEENHDYIDGGLGVDSMYGGAGNDTYVASELGDFYVENLNEGTDTVLASITFTLGNNLENLTLTGSGNINGTGNAGFNILLGYDGNNTLSGLDGTDRLTGGAGNDTLLGGNGNDTYYFDLGFGQDEINDAVGTNRITFGAGISATDVITEVVGADLFVALKDADPLVTASNATNRIKIVGGATVAPTITYTPPAIVAESSALSAAITTFSTPSTSAVLTNAQDDTTKAKAALIAPTILLLKLAA